MYGGYWVNAFQSPYGDYLVRNNIKITFNSLADLFQSPYGDYLVRNHRQNATANGMHSFSPLTGIT